MAIALFTIDMNELDLNFIEQAIGMYPEAFNDAHILEIGACDYNGNVRGPFPKSAQFTGIDWAEGKNVDIVVPAKDTTFVPDTFDALLSVNHLEHDPDWTESLGHNFPALKPGGLILLRWATRNSSPHGPEYDPHGKHGYYAKDLGEVVDFLKEQGMEVLFMSQDHNPYIGVMANVIAKKP